MFFITYCHFLYWQNMPLLSNSRKKISDLVTSLQLFIFPELPVGHNLYQRVLAPTFQCLSYEVVKVLLGCSLLTGKINVHKKEKRKKNKRKSKLEMRQDKTINKYINKRNSNWASLSVEKSSYFLVIGIHPFSYNCAQEKKKKKKQLFQWRDMLYLWSLWIKSGKPDERLNSCHGTCLILKTVWTSISNTLHSIAPLKATCSKLNATVWTLSFTIT